MPVFEVEKVSESYSNFHSSCVTCSRQDKAPKLRRRQRVGRLPTRSMEGTTLTINFGLEVTLEPWDAFGCLQ